MTASAPRAAATGRQGSRRAALWPGAVSVSASSSGPPPRREDWSRPGRLDEVMAHFDGWCFPWLDIAALVRATPVFYEYPMVDRDPLPRWTFGRMTLLGDAAHPMFPIGSNGASQAILDARNIAYVGDRTDNDVLPAADAGMRPILIRRGPWGHLHALRPEAKRATIIDSLDELPAAIRGT